jgi:hypothetical protein
VDSKRVRQRTGMSTSYPITVQTKQEGFQKSILQIQQWSVFFLFRDSTCDVLIENTLVQRRSHFCSSNWRGFGRWSAINDTSCFSDTRWLAASED